MSRALTAALTLLLTSPLTAQSVQYRSPAGVEYRAQSDTGPIARAQMELARDPKNVDRIIALGVAQSGAQQFREAIATFTRGLADAPNHAMLYRWRGHRYLSVREFDKADADLTRGLSLDASNYGILFHLGIIRFVQGRYAEAAELFRQAQPFAPNPGELKGSTDWRWMSLARAGRLDDAKAMLAQRIDSLPVEPGYAYGRRVALYRGEVQPADLFSAKDDAGTTATLSYGLGNWYLVHGDAAKARAMFERAVATAGGWATFGFIVSEVELRRVAR